MPKQTTLERLAVLEEKVETGFKATNKRIDEYSEESKSFHTELMTTLLTNLADM